MKTFTFTKDQWYNKHILFLRDGDRLDGYSLSVDELKSLRASLDNYLRDLDRDKQQALRQV